MMDLAREEQRQKAAVNDHQGLFTAIKLSDLDGIQPLGHLSCTSKGAP